MKGRPLVYQDVDICPVVKKLLYIFNLVASHGSRLVG